MRFEINRASYKTPRELCEIFFCLPFPPFYPPQLPGSKIIIIEDLPVKRVRNPIIFGRITDCETGKPIQGAIVKVFYSEEDEYIDLCHTFSGCNGYYLLRVPEGFEGSTMTIMSTCSNCPDTLESCECAE